MKIDEIDEAQESSPEIRSSNGLKNILSHKIKEDFRLISVYEIEIRNKNK